MSMSQDLIWRELAKDPQKTMTEFLKCQKIGNGWSITQSCLVHGSCSFDTSFESGMKPWEEDSKLSIFKKQALKRYKGNFHTAVFEYDIVAPSEIVLVVWIGSDPMKSLRTGNLTGRYIADCKWPSDMSPEQYKKTQQY